MAWEILKDLAPSKFFIEYFSGLVAHSQFLVGGDDINVLATYGEAMPDAFSADLNVGDTTANGGWSELEKAYAINLDPARLCNEPAIVEGISGKGRVILSLVHFDTPDDRNGSIVLGNLWRYLAGEKATKVVAAEFAKERRCESEAASLEQRNRQYRLLNLKRKLEDLISFGMRNFLWFWRNRMLLQWRRGARGLEYCNLYIMVKEIAGLMTRTPPSALEDAAVPGVH